MSKETQSKYENIFQRIRALTKRGQEHGFDVKVPRDLDARTFSNRITMAMQRNPVKTPRGTVVRKRKNATGKKLRIWIEAA